MYLKGGATKSSPLMVRLPKHLQSEWMGCHKELGAPSGCSKEPGASSGCSKEPGASSGCHKEPGAPSGVVGSRPCHLLLPLCV